MYALLIELLKLLFINFPFSSYTFKETFGLLFLKVSSDEMKICSYLCICLIDLFFLYVYLIHSNVMK